MNKCGLFQKVSLVLFVTLIIGCIMQVEAQENECPIRFAVIGDRTGGHTPGIYGQIVKEIERLKPDFVMTVGDMIEGYTEDTTVVNKEWKEYKSLLTPLTAPIYFTPGNHDIWDDTSLELYENHIGKPYYSFDIKNLHFIILDNSRWESSEELSEKQINWLISDLKKHKKAAYTFVFYHKPFWYETTAENESDTLHSLLRNFGVDAVFTGHYHIYFSGEYDEIIYTGVGSSGGGCDPGPTGLEYHFAWVTVDKKGISIALIKMGGVLPWDEVTASDLKFIDKIYLVGIDFEKPVCVKEDLTVADTKLVIEFNNLSPDFELEDTLHWEIPEGWFVEPENLHLKVKPGDSRTVEFKVKSEAKLYPVPVLSVHFPYAQGKNYELEKDLRIAREAYCYRAKTPPLIDGKISEPVWKNSVSRFFSPDGNPMSIDSVNFYFLYDEKNIYIAAYCKDLKIDSIAAGVTDHDGAVYGEDCVGYFFQPDIEKGIVYQIYFNPLGLVFDQKILVNLEAGFDADRTWNGTYEVKTIKGSDFWSIEACIPLDQFEIAIKPGQKWGLNFRRKQKRFNSSADWQVPITYDPETYGFLIMK